jgi:hypothetical protein
MAREAEPEPGPLAENPLVTRLVGDPGGRPDLTAAVGFLGRSARQGYWRLYFALDFSDYLEFAEGDVVHVEPLGPQDFPLAGSAVWFRGTATLERTLGGSRRAQADFLKGDLTLRYLGESETLEVFVGGDLVQRGLIRWTTLACQGLSLIGFCPVGPVTTPRCLMLTPGWPQGWGG